VPKLIIRVRHEARRYRGGVNLVPFHRDDADPTAHPPRFVPYSDTEFRHLFGGDKPPLSAMVLRRINAAKRTGGKVTDHAPDPREGLELP